MSFQAEHLSEPRRRIIEVIKKNGDSSVSDLSSLLDISGEAVRQHLLNLEKDGWISRFTEKMNEIGRPQIRYRLTIAGEHLFAKNYDHLTIEVLDTLVNRLGKNALNHILSAMIEDRISEWEPKMAGLSIEEKLDVLKDFYLADDLFMEVTQKENAYFLIERNCPFHNVAMKRPVLCSVTVSVLTHLLGCTVKREQRLQNGDGCCAFLVQLHDPVTENTPRIILEDEESNS